MKEILQRLLSYQTLSKEEAKNILLQISASKFGDFEVTAFITVYLMRSITIDELAGFREALLQLSHPLDLGTNELIDIVGTGGDGKNTFNISTLACFIAAGAGHKVCKHGNYGASTISGASNVMENLGYRFTNDSTVLKKQLDKANICFLHAPLFHPALKAVGPMRKQLGLRTFFNMLGPLVNPAQPKYQLIGTYNLEMARIYQYLLQKLDKDFTLLHALDGYDEISLTADTHVTTSEGIKIFTPEELGCEPIKPDDIKGGNTTEEAKEIFSTILQGKGTKAQNNVVCANAAFALLLTGKYKNYEEAFETAKDSLLTKKALQALNKLIDTQV